MSKLSEMPFNTRQVVYKQELEFREEALKLEQELNLLKELITHNGHHEELSDAEFRGFIKGLFPEV